MGKLTGIARHDHPRGPIETIDSVEVTVDGGLHGDFRGTVRAPGKDKRQVSLIEAKDWDAAMADVGHSLPWWHRRANLLVEDFDLPQTPGARIRIGDVVLEVTCECNPCSRMDELVDGLKLALMPDWRGGALARVISGGTISVGGGIAIEQD
ncbi:MOSC domain-containing protein [Stakelama tenebrarum]|uniref:MOSC domain-containing protein n=1 Tax=Stakelama tenebrarum TaxID=2711215 RepID=A0A6G6Y742_9SPHN|nr:MOSC domain-containing protein [Sphingosinithalassobacter tenebrarum]QIG80528.1 MOSC domain-containing protein [Sphingosinithalassobacter tenebrarum]